MTARDLYHVDFVEWAGRNAGPLRAGRLEEVDLEHGAAEIEASAGNQHRELGARRRALTAHRLELRADSGSRAARGGRSAVDRQREEMRNLSKAAQKRRRDGAEEAAGVRRTAVRKAAAGTRRPPSCFPQTGPFSPQQLLAPDFFPE